MPDASPGDANEVQNRAIAAYLRSYAQLKALVARRVGCSSAAADIVQDTYVRLAERAGAEIVNPEGYVRRAAGNLAIDWQRRQANSVIAAIAVPEHVACDEPSVEHQLDQRARLRRVIELAGELPPRCREVFVLRKLEGLHQDEIAEQLKISPNMVQKHLRKALAYIADRLED